MTAEAPILTPKLTLPNSTRRIVLTGFMGAGKSTVGRLLASELGWDFVDLDACLEERHGCSIAELFSLHGEVHFRRLESAALAGVLARANTVIALGGGTPELLTSRLLLEQTPGSLTVFLHAPYSVLVDRCLLQSFASPTHVRPLLNSLDEAEMRFRRREPLYRRLAHVTLATADLSPQQCVSELSVQITARSQRSRGVYPAS